MLQQYPLKNYNDIHTVYQNKLQHLDNIRSSIYSLDMDYQQISKELQRLEVIRSNMHSVLSILEQSSTGLPEVPDENIYSLLPYVSLGKNVGHALAISKYILKYPKLSILLLTKRPAEYVSEAPLDNCIIYSRNLNGFSQFIRGRHFDRVILDNFSKEDALNVLNNLPPVLQNVVISIGGCYDSTDD